MTDQNLEKIGYQPPVAILESVLYCDDLDACGKFYEQVVGLCLISFRQGRHRFYRLDGGMLLLFRAEVTSSEVVKVGGRVIPKHGAKGDGHLAFSVPSDSITHVRKRLNAFAVPIESEITWPGGGQSIYCRDPSGNSLEFATAKLWYGSHENGL